MFGGGGGGGLCGVFGGAGGFEGGRFALWSGFGGCGWHIKEYKIERWSVGDVEGIKQVVGFVYFLRVIAQHVTAMKLPRLVMDSEGVGLKIRNTRLDWRRQVLLEGATSRAA